MNCRKRAGGSKFTRGISQRARAVAITATLGNGNYVNQYGHSRYLYQLWVVNYVCFSKSCYNKCNQKRHVIETHAFKSQARSGVDDIV